MSLARQGRCRRWPRQPRLAARTRTHDDIGMEGMTMQLHGSAGRRPRRLVLGMTATAALAMTLAACSGSGSSTAQVTATQSAKAKSAAAPATSAPAQAAAASGLSGKWRGQYSGAYQGHFLLRWHQSGSRLTGTIALSAPARGTVPIHGTVQHDQIRHRRVRGHHLFGLGVRQFHVRHLADQGPRRRRWRRPVERVPVLTG
jgi:hypothetical protein